MKPIPQVARFCVTGILVILTDFGIYSLLSFAIPHAAAKSISFAVGGILAYFLNKYWTFSQNQNSFSEIIRFTIVNGLALVLNVAVNEGMLVLLNKRIIPAFMIATILTSCFLYVGLKVWVFRRLESEKEYL